MLLTCRLTSSRLALATFFSKSVISAPHSSQSALKMCWADTIDEGAGGATTTVSEIGYHEAIPLTVHQWARLK